MFAFRGKDASLILPSEAAEREPIATGEKRSLGAFALEVGSERRYYDAVQRAVCV